MFKDKNDGCHRLEFYFGDDGVGWLVTDDKAQVEAWFEAFKVGFHDSGFCERAESMGLFIDGNFIREHRYESLKPVA